LRTNNSGVNDVEKNIRKYLVEAQDKLENDFSGTREAIKLISQEKTKDFMKLADRGLDKDERELLSTVVMSSMFQAFCFGYGIGKLEGRTNRKVFL